MLPLLLASSSPYRRQLLARLGLAFTHASPSIDETRLPHEPATDLVRRLAMQKAQALSCGYQGLIIGSDQVAVLGNEVLGKPHTFDNGFQQLRAASGRRVDFLTGIALLNTASGRLQVDHAQFAVHFRDLSDNQIERYLRRDTPYDCAGSFKAEGLGISLFSKTEGEDVTSLIGLPLIRLVDMLANEGVEVP
ncbi:Maf family protein [Stutzerimonas urumqiensis]|uniref:Maf family protein n=1 Tax=Stutzerimonas urumqiensis TaxID=638269 RepID=UPI000EB536DD|nr:nucleoside triphosphate pyrophosphatase [Stutzerimonas urumqiensis]